MALLFGNLLSNSLKYAKKTVSPVINIECTLLIEDETSNISSDKNYYRIDFCDNGIGFDEEHSEQIFRIFERLHNKLEYDGTGIGLAMCKKIVQAHKGSIYATADDKRGTVFTIIFPSVY